jgi:oxaloacetate decarboxylase gamma subunit
MQTTLIDQGLDLMLFGMGSVFGFLLLLVLATRVMSLLVNRWLPEELVSGSVSEAGAGVQPSTIDPKIVKVIQSAIDRHRGGLKRD